MESSIARADGTRRRERGSIRATQAGVLIAALGACLVVFNPLGLAVAGIFVGLGGVLIAAPGGIGHGWFWALAAGAIVVAISRLVAESAVALGGWLAVIGAVTILIGATLGFPSRRERH